MEIMQRAFQIEQKDNVATALEELIPGALRLLGDGCMREAEAVQKIPKGCHKIRGAHCQGDKGHKGRGMGPSSQYPQRVR